MQECTINLRLGGSLLHTVQKDRVTPAEIQVLRALHGPDAVTDIVPTKMTKRGHEQEFVRLTELYGRANGADMIGANDPQKNLIASLFPGAAPTLPVTLKDIGLGHLLTAASRATEPKKEIDLVED
jgi:hypothetical protein